MVFVWKRATKVIGSTSLEVLSADDRPFANSLDPDQTQGQAGSGSQLIDTLMAFLIEFFEHVSSEKINKQQKYMQNYPACKE